ncbi:MAG: hypothetical protein KAU02_05290 [Tenericutes bacterium]|nr:hypothetical protein [Mycoplasmatota bacterium]
MKRLINLLKNNNKVDEWKINTHQDHSTELFFIKEDLQMNRAKDVEKISVTVYKNLEIDGNKFKGSSFVVINPSDTDKEVGSKIDKAILSASFVKNEFYTLPKPVKEKAPEITSKFSEGDVVDTISEIVKELYAENNQFGAFINSAEFFITTSTKRIINSNGIDVTYNNYSGLMEIITEIKGEKEATELFEIVEFSDFDREFIKNSIIEQLKYTALRGKAIKTPKLDGIPVIISGKAVNEFWQFYLVRADASSKYQKLFDCNVGDNLLGEDVLGDKLTLTAAPYVHNSTRNSYYDVDGLLLKETIIIEDGIIKNILSSHRYSEYLNIKPTGGLRNTIIKGGQFTEDELRKDPYLEVVSFSAFQMDFATGFFGGEFRLALYHDGDNVIPVTQGAVTANLKEAQKTMYFSKETVNSINIVTPKILKFEKMTIVGEN